MMPEDTYQAILDLGRKIDDDKNELVAAIQSSGNRLESIVEKGFGSLEESIRFRDSMAEVLDFSRKLQWLDQAFARCKRATEQARIAGRLKDPEREDIINAWGEINRRYVEVLTIMEKRLLGMKNEIWPKLAQEVKKTWNHLDHSIKQDRREEIVDQIQNFSRVLETVLAVTLDEIDAHIRMQPAIRKGNNP